MLIQSIYHSWQMKEPLPGINVSYNFKKLKIERHKRFCTLCNENKLGDEYHILFECTNEKVVLNRLTFVSNFYSKRPSMLQCINLMRSENNKDILSLFLINVLCLYK